MRAGASGAHTFPPARIRRWAKFGDWTRRTEEPWESEGGSSGLGLSGFWAASCGGQEPGSNLKAGVWRPDTQIAGVQASLLKF